MGRWERQQTAQAEPCQEVRLGGHWLLVPEVQDATGLGRVSATAFRRDGLGKDEWVEEPSSLPLGLPLLSPAAP